MKFCFWGNISTAINGATIGGAELQISLLAKSLAMAGHEVVVIDPHANDSFVTQEGIRIIHIPDWNKGWPVIRIFWNRIPALYKLLVKQKADYYYVRMRSYFHFLSFWAAKKNKSKFIVALAHDIDVLSLRDKYRFEYREKFKLIKYFNDWFPGDVVFNYLLKRADYIVKQHSGQNLAIHSIRGKSFIFPNILKSNSFPEKEKDSKTTYIYVGTLTMVKGVDKLYEIIKYSQSQSSFTIVGKTNDIKAIPIFEKIKKLENADVKGQKNHQDTLQLMAKVKALVSTSEYEGFPNVFLEAWAMGIPVLSYKVNPGNIFEKYDLGICFNGDLEKMKEYISQNKTPDISKEKLQSYIKEFHDFDSAANRFLMALNNA